MLAQQTARAVPAMAPRALQVPLDIRKGVTLVGIHRSGKTHLLYGTMRRLIEAGVDRRRLIGLNFEDDSI